jgi:hypothetical protein
MIIAENQITGKYSLIFWGRLFIVGKDIVFFLCRFAETARNVLRFCRKGTYSKIVLPNFCVPAEKSSRGMKGEGRIGNIKYRKVMLQWVRLF